MFHEGEFTAEIIESFHGWTDEIKPYLERHPVLTEVDLVIEGGVGNGITMPHLARILFPQAIYIGTDLQPQLARMNSLARLNGQIDERSIERLTNANTSWQLDMRDATLICANCFDFSLVADLCTKLQRQNPVLVSFNAVGALTDRKMTMYDRKARADDITIARWFTDSPFIAQLHIGTWPVAWNKSGETMIDDAFFWVRDEALAAGYAVEEMPMGLLAVRQ